MALDLNRRYKLTEEIVRWRFELQIKNSANWWIAFTNPTAGPWKRLLGKSATGNFGEVYRFGRKEDRPDVVAVNDVDRTILIVEAKDEFSKLLLPAQVEKSCDVVSSLQRKLNTFNDNPFWGVRATYNVVAGLLWGADIDQSLKDISQLVNTYQRSLPTLSIVAFETQKLENGCLHVADYSSII